MSDSKLPEMLQYGLSQDAPLDAAITSCTESFVSSQATTHSTAGNNTMEFVLDGQGAYDLRKCYIEATATLVNGNNPVLGTTASMFNRIVVSTLGGQQLAETTDSDVVFSAVGYGAYNQSACDASLSPYLGQRDPRIRNNGATLNATQVLINFDSVPFFQQRCAFPSGIVSGIRVTLHMNPVARYLQGGTADSLSLTNAKLHFTHLSFTPSFRDALSRKYSESGLQLFYESFKTARTTAFSNVQNASIPISHSAERCSDVTVCSLADANTNEAFTVQMGANTEYSLRIGSEQYPTSKVDSTVQAYMQMQHVNKAHHAPTEHAAITLREFSQARTIQDDDASAITSATRREQAKSGRQVLSVGLDKDDSAVQSISGIPILAGSSSFDITNSAANLGQLVVIMNTASIASFADGQVSVVS